MIAFIRAEDQDELAELVPLIQGYIEVNPEEPAEGVLLLMKIMVELDDGIVIKAMDKGKPIGYIMGVISTDFAGRKLNVIGIYAYTIGTGKLLLEKVEGWARDEKDTHSIRSLTKRNPEAMARLFDARVTGYVLEKEF